MEILGWQCELTRPWCLAALLVLPLLVHYWRRSLVNVARWRHAALLGCRLTLVVVLVLVLCDIRIWRTETKKGPGLICAKHPPGRSGKLNLVPFSARVLLVDSKPLLSRHLAAGLKGQDIDAEVRPPRAVPKSLAELRGYELVILSNVPAAALATRQMEAMRSYVRDFGGGLIVIGGDRALTPGGYRHTTLEEILPVLCDSRKEKPSLAMVLVIDRSKSMEKGGAMEWAKEATRRAVGMLGPKDQLGVIAFEETGNWVSRLHPCTVSGRAGKPLILERINTIEPGAGTNMYPAVEKAYLALDEAFAELKHMIILTDGISHPGDFQSLLSEIAASGITVSTVGVGPEVAVPLLEDIARIGRGHFYYCADPAAMPKIFALDTASAGKVGISQQPFVPRLVHHERFLEGVDFRQMPLLWGHVQTRPKPSGRVILASGEGDPVLIWWRFGSGVSAVFTSDVQNRWAADWLKWSDFGPFWAQLARHAMRKDPARNFTLDARIRQNRVTVSLEAVDPEGQFLNNAKASLTVVEPERNSRKLPLGQVAPGRYATEFTAPRDGTYHLELALISERRTVFKRSAGLIVDHIEEHKPAAVFTPTEQTLVRTIVFWPRLLTMALLIFVLDIAVRRLGKRGQNYFSLRQFSEDSRDCQKNSSDPFFPNNGPSSSSLSGLADDGQEPMARCSFSAAGSKTIVCKVSRP